MTNIILLMIGVLMTATAHLLLRGGMIKFGSLFVERDKFIFDFIRLATNLQIILGLILFAAGFFIWLKILSLFEVSKAYPIMVSATISLVLIGSSLILKENVSFLRVLGVIVVILGIFLIFKS